LQLQPGTNVAVINSLAHVIVTEGLADTKFITERCEPSEYAIWSRVRVTPENSPEAMEAHTGVPAAQVREAARLFATGGNGAIYYGLGVTEHSQGSTMVMGMANLAMAPATLARDGVGVNPLRGQNNVQGSCDMGSFPHELPGYRHVSDDATRTMFEQLWGTVIQSEPGLRIPNMFDNAIDGNFKGLFVHGEDIAQSDPNTAHVESALSSMECVIVQDFFLNETARFAHVFFPGTSFLEKDGTFTNAERRINRVRPTMRPQTGKHEWQIVCELANAMGHPMHYNESRNHGRDCNAHANVCRRVVCSPRRRQRSVAMQRRQPNRHANHAQGQVCARVGKFTPTPYVPTEEKSNRKFPLLLTTGRILSQYNVGAQTRRTKNVQWHPEDILEIHPSDALERGVKHGEEVTIASRVGNTVLRAEVTERVAPGVVYTTFHYPKAVPTSSPPTTRTGPPTALNTK
jgi:formate dehydrogenase major subunit